MNILAAVFIIILGACMGSFFSVVICRVRSGQKGILFGRSNCPDCKKILNPKNLIPVISYIIQKAKCSHCEKKISAIYPSLEIVTALLFLLAYLLSPFNTLYLIILLLIFSGLSLIFFYDVLYQEIPDRFSIPTIILSLVLIFLNPDLSIQDALIGALIPTIFFGLQFALSKGTWIGGGDLRLGIIMGLLLGTKNVIVALFLSYILGAVLSVFLIASKKLNKKSQIAFGPFLIIGTIITLFYGNQIIETYLNLILY